MRVSVGLEQGTHAKVQNKESYENMKILMEAINYNKFQWQICGDIKLIALLLGL
jgi:hypothetical protein